MKERKRIEWPGHEVINNKVDDFLAVLRALGVFKYKDKKDLSPENQAITAVA